MPSVLTLVAWKKIPLNRNGQHWAPCPPFCIQDFEELDLRILFCHDEDFSVALRDSTVYRP